MIEHKVMKHTDYLPKESAILCNNAEQFFIYFSLLVEKVIDEQVHHLGTVPQQSLGRKLMYV